MILELGKELGIGKTTTHEQHARYHTALEKCVRAGFLQTRESQATAVVALERSRPNLSTDHIARRIQFSLSVVGKIHLEICPRACVISLVRRQCRPMRQYSARAGMQTDIQADRGQYTQGRHHNREYSVSEKGDVWQMPQSCGSVSVHFLSLPVAG